MYCKRKGNTRVDVLYWEEVYCNGMVSSGADILGGKGSTGISRCTLMGRVV